MGKPGNDMPEVIRFGRTDSESQNLSPKVLKSMNSSCKMVEVVTSPSSPSHSSSSTVLKDTPRSNKDPCSESARRASHPGEDDVQSSAPTPCANTVMIGKRPSRQREAANKRRRSEWGQDSEDEEEKVGICSVQTPAGTAGTEKADKTITPDNRHKGPCSYDLCPNPTHSSGGGFKIVTQETKAGHRSWSKWVGRVFCNACFTQYATRGTFERPGRQYGPTGSVAEKSPAPAAPLPPSLSREDPASERARSAKPVIPTVPLYRPVPCEVDVAELKETKADLRAPHQCLELSVQAAGRNVRYQWLRDGQRIPGATSRSLLLRGSEQCRGNISCRLSNEYGSAPLFTPVRLPLSPEQALHKYTGEGGNLKAGEARGVGDASDQQARDRAEAKVFKLHCVCGKVTKGSPVELATVPCQCGRLCCGRTVPVKGDAEDEDMDSFQVETPAFPGSGLLPVDLDAHI